MPPPSPTESAADAALRQRIAELERDLAGRDRLIREQAETIATLQQSATQASPGAAKASSGRALTPIPGYDFTLVFDGGSKGNPGLGYGSYRIVDASGEEIAGEMLQYGDGITNNGAEFRTLNAALRHLSTMLSDKTPASTVAIRGDSELVIRGVKGDWKIKHPDLQPLKAEAVALLSQFKKADLQWHARRHSVGLLGH